LKNATLKYEAGSTTAPPRLPSWNCILRQYSTADGPIWAKFGNLIQN